MGNERGWWKKKKRDREWHTGKKTTTSYNVMCAERDGAAGCV